MYFDKTADQADQLLQCIICGDNTTLHCMRCHKPYCSKACQRLDWDGLGEAATKQKAQANQEAGSKTRVGDHKAVCYVIAGPYNVVQRLTTPPPRPPTPTPPPLAQPVSSFRLWL